MKNIKQLSPYGKRVLIITSILSLGLIWFLYLCMYGFYEFASIALNNRNEGVKKRSSTFAKLSQVSYWVFFIIAPIVLLSWDLTKSWTREVHYSGNTNDEVSAVGAFGPLLSDGIFYTVIIVVIILVSIFLIGLYISAFPMTQLGMKLIYYPYHKLSTSFYPLIVLGTILTLGFNWILFLIVFGIHYLISNLYSLEQSQNKIVSITGIISSIVYTIFLIDMIENYISSQKTQHLVFVIIILISSVSLYGLLQVAFLRINKDKRSYVIINN